MARGNYYAPQGNLAAAASLFSRGSTAFANSFSNMGDVATQYGDRIEKLAQNRAIAQLMGQTPDSGGDTVVGSAIDDGGYDTSTLDQATGQLTPAESALDFRSRQMGNFSQVPGIDPMLALGLANKTADPYFKQEATDQAQSNADRLFGFNQDKFETETAYKDANLQQKQSDATATANYRGNVLSENSRHNKIIETPTDIREAYSAGYATGVNKDGKKYLTTEDFKKYQTDKSKAKFSQRQLDPSTIDKNKAMTNKQFDDILFKQLGKEGYEKYNQLPADQRKDILNYWLDNGIIDYKYEGNTFSPDVSEQGTASQGYQRQATEPTNTSETSSLPAGYKTIGDKVYDENGKRVK